MNTENTDKLMEEEMKERLAEELYHDLYVVENTQRLVKGGIVAVALDNHTVAYCYEAEMEGGFGARWRLGNIYDIAEAILKRFW